MLMFTICLLGAKAGSASDGSIQCAVHSVCEKQCCHSQACVLPILQFTFPVMCPFGDWLKGGGRKLRNEVTTLKEYRKENRVMIVRSHRIISFQNQTKVQ